MPQIILEHSSNLSDISDSTELFAQLHSILNQTGGINIANCKSRLRIAHDFYIGNGDSDNAFVHLEVRFIAGRSDHIKQALGRLFLALLEAEFELAMQSYNLQITVEIGDINPDLYFKYPANSLTPR